MSGQLRNLGSTVIAKPQSHDWLMMYAPYRAACGTFPHPVALMQLRFTSVTVLSSRRDLHAQECALAGHT